MSCIKIPAAQTDVSSRTVETNDNLLSALNKHKELINLANKVFVNSWSHSVTNSVIDFIECNAGKYCVGCQATVKVQLPNGIYHEDVGYSNIEASTKGLAIEKARMTSVTNALSKVLLCFAEMEVEMEHLNSIQNHISNIPIIEKTKFPLKRPITPPPPAQSTPKVPRTPKTLERLQGKNTTNTISSVISNGLKVPESHDRIDTETDTELDIIFETPVQLNVPSVSNATSTSSASTSVTLSEEEMRLERKRKQREKQEEYKRFMMGQEKVKQVIRQEVQKPNPKF